MITPILRSKDAMATWLIDVAGNVAISISDLALLKRIRKPDHSSFCQHGRSNAMG